jgi:transcriptional regulator with XRE-family HTH domain
MGRKKLSAAGVHLDLKAVGTILRRGRENLRFSYRELSEKCGISPTQLMRMESGEFEYSLVKFMKLCLTLGIPAGGALEAATVGEFAFDRSKIESHIAEIIGRKDAKDFKFRLLNCTSCVWNYFQTVWRILTDGSPIGVIRETTFPDEQTRIAFERFAAMVGAFTNVERITMLEALLNDPINFFRFDHCGTAARGCQWREKRD